MIFKIPLAWLQLKREKIRLLVAIVGIGFANILMFVQLGFRDALFESATRPHQSMQGDIFLVSPQSTALIAMKSFSNRRLYQARSFDGVESVSPIYLDFALWKSLAKPENPNDRPTRGILVFGFNPDDLVFNLPEINQNLNVIKTPDVVIYDQDSRGEFGDVAKEFKKGNVVSTEVGNRKITVGGLFKLGPSFGASGNIITSDLNFLRIFARRDRGLIDIGMIKVKPGTDVEKLVQSMQRYFNPEQIEKQIREKKLTNIAPITAEEKARAANDVWVLSKEEFVDFEKSYWQKNSSIGFIFGLGTVMGFMVGAIIVYQILYTDVSDHLPEYATLKAMGYTDMYLLTVVFQEAVILALLGYIPGITVASGFYNVTRNATSLPLGMTSDRAIFVLLMTFVMCFISGAIAVRRLRSADPADIF